MGVQKYILSHGKASLLPAANMMSKEITVLSTSFTILRLVHLVEMVNLEPDLQFTVFQMYQYQSPCCKDYSRIKLSNVPHFALLKKPNTKVICCIGENPFSSNCIVCQRWESFAFTLSLGFWMCSSSASFVNRILYNLAFL